MIIQSKSGGWNKGLTKENDKRVMNISRALSGRDILWFDKISQTLKRKYKNNQIKNQKKENNGNWKGSKASYAGFHARINREKGQPLFCEICNTTDKNKTYEWASISKNYKDLTDYKRLCKSCHNKLDNVGVKKGNIPWNKGKKVNEIKSGIRTK